MLESQERKSRAEDMDAALEMKGLTGGVLRTYPMEQFLATRPLADRRRRSQQDQMDQYIQWVSTKDKKFKSLRDERQVLEQQ